MKIEEKAACFVAALTDIYKDEEKRNLCKLPKIQFSEDLSGDFTAMLIAMEHVYELFTGDKERDLIDFTHILNKLAFQYVMERMEDDGK